jgi:hypothetical protein
MSTNHKMASLILSPNPMHFKNHSQPLLQPWIMKTGQELPQNERNLVAFFNDPSVKAKEVEFEIFLDDADCRNEITLYGRVIPIRQVNFMQYLEWLRIDDTEEQLTLTTCDFDEYELIEAA